MRYPYEEPCEGQGYLHERSNVTPPLGGGGNVEKLSGQVRGFLGIPEDEYEDADHLIKEEDHPPASDPTVND